MKVIKGKPEDNKLAKSVESAYNAKFVDMMAIRTKDGSWMAQPFHIFYQADPKPEHSHYFAIFNRNGITYITDASSVAGIPIVGVVANNGDVIYSRWGHDFRTSPDQSVSIDGGREMTKVMSSSINNEAKTAILVLEDGEIKVAEDPDALMVAHKLKNS